MQTPHARAHMNVMSRPFAIEEPLCGTLFQRHQQGELFRHALKLFCDILTYFLLACLVFHHYYSIKCDVGTISRYTQAAVWSSILFLALEVRVDVHVHCISGPE